MCACICVCVYVCVCVCVCVCECVCELCLFMYKFDKSKQCYNCHMYNTISRIDEISKVNKLSY